MTYLAFLIFLAAQVAYSATPLQCPAYIDVGYSNKSEFELNPMKDKRLTKILLRLGYVRTGFTDRDPSLMKILKKNGYERPIHDEGLQLILKLETDQYMGKNSNSRSRAFIYQKDKNGKNKMILEARKDFKATYYEVTSPNGGTGTELGRGASYRGARRRLLKAIKKIPTCEELIEAPKEVAPKTAETEDN